MFCLKINNSGETNNTKFTFRSLSNLLQPKVPQEQYLELLQKVLENRQEGGMLGCVLVSRKMELF